MGGGRLDETDSQDSGQNIEVSDVNRSKEGKNSSGDTSIKKKSGINQVIKLM